MNLNSLLEFCLPKAVQAEFYGLLRSGGGIAIRTERGAESYKQVVEGILQTEYGWDRKGEDIIEQYLGRTITSLQVEAAKGQGQKKPLNDLDDYPIMAEAIIHNADIIDYRNL